jgi:hypothetical protein
MLTLHRRRKNGRHSDRLAIFPTSVQINTGTVATNPDGDPWDRSQPPNTRMEPRPTKESELVLRDHREADQIRKLKQKKESAEADLGSSDLLFFCEITVGGISLGSS